jgi:hypothetical protein
MGLVLKEESGVVVLRILKHVTFILFFCVCVCDTLTQPKEESGMIFEFE